MRTRRPEIERSLDGSRLRRVGGRVNASHPVVSAAAALPRAKYLVGVSGGRDSTAMLHALVEAGHRRLVVCHLDHGLRGRASRADAAFVQRLAERLGLACRIGRTDVAGLAVTRRLSTEAAGRQARHEFFAACAAEERCRRVVLAHHGEDQAETVLFNLLRGSGLTGAAGMEMRSEMPLPGVRRPLEIWRPLLNVRGAEIADWCRERKLKWREDASNQSDAYARNRLRREALPLLSSILGRDVAPLLCRFAALAAEEDAALEMLAAECLASSLSGRELNSIPLRSMPAALQRRVLRLWLRGLGLPEPGSQGTEAVRAMLPAEGPKATSLPGGLVVKRTRGVLRIAETPPPQGFPK